MEKHEGAEITEDDLLEEPDVSLEEETKENTEEVILFPAGQNIFLLNSNLIWDLYKTLYGL